jgi:hypothetical protein
MRLTYVGGIDEVEVPLPTGGVVACKRGGECDIPDSVAAGLLDQPDNWRRAKEAAKPKADVKPADKEGD